MTTTTSTSLENIRNIGFIAYFFFGTRSGIGRRLTFAGLRKGDKGKEIEFALKLQNRPGNGYIESILNQVKHWVTIQIGCVWVVSPRFGNSTVFRRRRIFKWAMYCYCPFQSRLRLPDSTRDGWNTTAYWWKNSRKTSKY